MMSHGLGRLYAPDARDQDFPMRRLLAAAERTEGARYWWAGGGWFNQGTDPICVGASSYHWLLDGPVTGGLKPDVDPVLLYRLAQENDEWEGEGYEGSSVRGAAKGLAALGYLTSYWWAWDLETVVRALLNRGPVILGTDWWSAMEDPDTNGRAHVSGSIEGGHAYLANGVNTRARLVRCKNSWGRDWGRRGYFYLDFDDLGRLLEANGEAMVGVEVRG